MVEVVEHLARFFSCDEATLKKLAYLLGFGVNIHI
jgi:hypothetical protein